MHEAVKSRGIGVLDHLGDHHSLASDSADDCDFARSASTNMLSLTGVLVPLFPADESFVNFDFAIERECIAFHRGPPAMADVPASTPISTGVFAEHHAPHLKRAKTLLRGHHQEADFEP